MRRVFNLIAFTLLVGVAQSSFAHKDSVVAVRSDADLVRFRDGVPPPTLPDDELRHLSRLETLHADRQVLGPSDDGRLLPWIHMTNRATGEDGWALSKYVRPVDPADMERLRALPMSKEPLPPPVTAWQAFDSEWNLTAIAAAASILAALAGAIVFLVRFLRKRQRIRYTRIAANRESNVLPFPEQTTEPPTLFGMANGQVWVHRANRKARK
ncbi:MAG: hypothetical protein DMF56_20725 [Acidobacteria bacterium]|nr:MAG: hypothetical protein DMF56_20725 [Acidobacteriota bacterium]